MNDSQARAERLQIMLTQNELTALDDWRFKHQMPSRAAAVRELLRRGLSAEGFVVAERGQKSKAFSIIDVGSANGSSGS